MAKAKPFTGTGDSGFTATARARVRKDTDLMEAIGSLDELVAYLGLARALSKGMDDVSTTIRAVQVSLFRFSAALISMKGFEVTPSDVDWLEKETLEYDSKLPALRRFIIPGGTELSSVLHIARTICRRAERRVVRLKLGNKEAGCEIAFMNRLSSLLFVLARYTNMLQGASEELF
ncbi:MAG TPA: cob(I)yrinic acid a,c-diamide adenosyltransferase [Conexivisphaerales archaeon]|nr:cob(I)yrinic acid a,c-diamide adenosyltransferase [Conexivisphaerales archaeon]